MFEKAVRQDLRFPSSKGLLVPQQLWQLSLTDLNKIAMSVNKEIRNSEEESFIAVADKSTTENRLRLEILKHIIHVRQKENEQRLNKAKVSAQRAKIEEALAHRKDAELLSKTPEELAEMLKALED